MGTPLSPEQTRLLKECQEKWLRIALSTELIDPEQAKEAVKQAYRINGFAEPKIYLMGSPFAGMQKLAEYANDLEVLGEGLNQEIQGHNEWFFTHQRRLSEHQPQITQPLNYITYLFSPVGKHLEEILLYHPKDQQPVYPLPQMGISLEDTLEQYAQFMQAACAMPPSLFYNVISTDSLAEDYCRWDFGFSVLGWAHSPEKWTTSSTLLTNCGWIMPFKKVCVICDRPSKILIDDLNRLHAVGEPAITFRDGYSIYAHHGELLGNGQTELTPQDYSENPKAQLRQAIVERTLAEELPISWLFQESNWAVRQLLLNKLGHQRVSPALELESIGLSDQLLVRDIDSMLWLIRSLVEHRNDLHIQSAIAAIRLLSNKTEAEKLDSLRKTILMNSIDRIMTWLQDNAPESFASFAIGLQPEEVHSKLEALPYHLPQEVYDLYCWRDGTDRDSDQGLFVYHSFMSLDTAIENSEYINYEDQRESRTQDGDPTYLLPIFDFEGEYFAVAASSDNATAASPIYHISDCLDCRIAFNSLGAMMLTMAESYETGVYTIDASIGVDWTNTRLFEEIRRKYNPGTVETLYHYS
jgi:hypothetical protein